MNRIDRHIIKFLYGLGLLIASLFGIGLLIGGLAVLVAIIAGFMRSGFVGILILVLSPLLVLIYGIIAKVWLETLVAVSRMTEQIEVMAPEAIEREEPLLAYCIRCRANRPIQDPEPTVAKGGRSAVRGTCPECGTNLFRFVSMELATEPSGGEEELVSDEIA